MSRKKPTHTTRFSYPHPDDLILALTVGCHYCGIRLLKGNTEVTINAPYLIHSDTRSWPIVICGRCLDAMPSV